MTIVKVMPQFGVPLRVINYAPGWIIYTLKGIIYDVYSTGITQLSLMIIINDCNMFIVHNL